MPTQKYKIIVQKDGESWVKEKNSSTSTECTRHKVIEGTRGGKSFENNTGKKVYVNTIRKQTTVYPSDSMSAPPTGQAPFGNPGAAKKPKI